MKSARREPTMLLFSNLFPTVPEHLSFLRAFFSIHMEFLKLAIFSGTGVKNSVTAQLNHNC